MNEKFFPELSCRLRRESITIGELADDRLPVLLKDQAVVGVDVENTIFSNAQTVNDPECVKLYDRVAEISAQVYDYTTTVASAHRLEAEGLHDNFRLLAGFNNVVLAGREMEGGLGYEFATWRYSADRTGVTHGNYHYNYDSAKLDFACRAGLVQDSRQFSDEQLVEMYRCIHETLDSGHLITRERHDTLIEAANQIERSVDDLDERVSLSNQRELAVADQRNDIPGLEMTS